MRIFPAAGLAIVLAAVACFPAGAQTPAAQNGGSLPDWSGEWQVAGSVKLIEPSSRYLSAESDPRTRDHPPYTASWEAKYIAALPRALLQGQKGKDALTDSYTRLCAAGVPRLMASPFTLEFAISPAQTWIIFYASEVRHIYTDPRFKVSDGEIVPSVWGYSYGHWNNGVLTIDTKGLQGNVWLDTTPLVLSDAAQVHERIYRVSPELMEDDLVISDPQAFTKPWRISRQYKMIKNFIPAGEDTCKGAPASQP